MKGRNFMVTTFDRNDVSNGKGFAILMAVFPFLFFLPYLSETKRNSPYMRFRANQTFVYFLSDLLWGIIAKVLTVLTFIPLIGTLIGIFKWIIGILISIYWIIGIVCAATEEAEGRKYPIIGEITILS